MVNLFAKTNFRDKEEVFGIKEDDRRRHMYLLGKTGMGKTNLLKTMVIQDIRAGKGVAYVDPHGDTAEELMSFIPKDRLNDIVYFNPSDLSYPVAFNVLETVDEEHKHLIASGMMGVFKKIWPDVWSPRMEHILNYTILALLDYPDSTMLGINRMLADKQFRSKVLNKLKDPIVKSFWVNEFSKWNERYVGEAIAPIQNKVGQFIATPVIRNIISQAKSTINMREIMDEGKIFIVNLSKGKIGEEAMQLLGGMVVTKLQLAAMERVDIPEQDRKDFYLYVDEFQNFATESFANILSEARKYRLNLVMAHQYISQLVDEGNTYMRDAIFGNVGTMISFRIGAEDAELVAKEFEPVIFPYDLVNLPKYHVYLKLMINGVAGDAFSATTLAPVSPAEDAEPDKIIRVSRERYGRPRKKVEEKIARWSGYLGMNIQENKGNEESKQVKQVHERINSGRAQNEKQTESVSVNSAGGKNNQDKKMFKAVCDECGKQVEVPFEPDGVRGTYCQDCLKKIRRQRAKLTDMDQSVLEKTPPISLNEAKKNKPVSIKKKVDLVGLNQLIQEAVNPDSNKSEHKAETKDSSHEKNSKERKED